MKKLFCIIFIINSILSCNNRVPENKSIKNLSIHDSIITKSKEKKRNDSIITSEGISLAKLNTDIDLCLKNIKKLKSYKIKKDFACCWGFDSEGPAFLITKNNKNQFVLIPETGKKLNKIISIIILSEKDKTKEGALVGEMLKNLITNNSKLKINYNVITENECCELEKNIILVFNTKGKEQIGFYDDNLTLAVNPIKPDVEIYSINIQK
ncbi:MAG: hypothetical protein HYR91_14915 [Flavobacteriia bacterium]|nr:hypothetical protein [Flavobacteriia bacterium]